MRLFTFPRIALAAAGLSMVLAACGNSTSTTAPTSTSPSSTAPPPARTLTVFLAGSLTKSFAILGKQFQSDNPGVSVKFTSIGSAELAQQIVAGAPADVFAAAGDAAMKPVTDAMKADGTPVIFATNVLEIATPPGNPKSIASFADLDKPGVKVSVCDPTTACGMAALKVEQAAGVTLRPVSQEPSLEAVLSQVTSGSADAGLAYVTDVISSKGAVMGVMFPQSSAAVTNYPITVVKGAPQADLANKFVALVTGPFGKTTLQGAGFGSK